MQHIECSQCARAVWQTAVLIAATSLLVPTANAQTSPSRLQGPVPVERRSPDINRDLLSRERFRRKAAEAAQKQLEALAGQLREQLVKEIAARKAAESKLADLTARTILTEQIDQERQRLRDDTAQKLEARRALQERELSDLKRRLKLETDQRKALETRTNELAQRNDSVAVNELNTRIKDLERQLTTAEWARKLAEAQLKLVNKRQRGQ